MAGKYAILLSFILITFGLRAQSYTYTYTDPCTGVLQSVTINQPTGTVTMFYAGQYQTFTATQLASGGFENWVAQINAQFPPGTNPCAGNGASNTNNFNTQLGNNTANNITNIVSIATSVAGSTGAGIPSGGTSTNDNGGGSNDQGGNPNTGTSGGSSGGNSGGTSGGSSGGGSGGDPGSGSTGGTSGGSSGGGVPDPGAGQSGTEGGGGSGVTEPTTGTEQGAVGESSTTTASGGDSESSSSEGGGGGGGKPKSKQEKIGRGALIGAGDFVIIRNSSNIQDTGKDNFKFNASVTHVNTKQNFIKGINLNYQTGENIANLTAYGSYKAKGFMGVGSNSVMTNFTSDWFNTTSLMFAQKTGPATWMLGNNFTFGEIGKSSFSNWSMVGGAYTNFKGGKSFGMNVMLLAVYSPYLFYYEGQWYKSGLLFIPLSNIDFKLTDKFKWSISFAGTYQYQADILNFQLSTGTKILL